MLILIIGAIVVFGLLALANLDSPRAQMEEYCRMECIERKIRDRSICC